MSGRKKDNEKAYRYLKGSAVVSNAIHSKVRLIVGGVCGFVFGVSVILGISGVETESGNFRDDLLLSLIMFAFNAWLFYLGFMQGRRNEAARRYELIFDGDRDGVVTIQELSDSTGKDKKAVMAELEPLFRKGYFQGCTLIREGPDAGVRLADACRSTANRGFIPYVCPKCGGTGRIRAGTVGACEYCGEPIKVD